MNKRIPITRNVKQLRMEKRLPESIIAYGERVSPTELKARIVAYREFLVEVEAKIAAEAAEGKCQFACGPMSRGSLVRVYRSVLETQEQADRRVADKLKAAALKAKRKAQDLKSLERQRDALNARIAKMK